MKVLIACEESQIITIEMRKLGIEAYSCDILECSGGHTEWHIKGDAIKEAYSGKYDLMIAHPPCTHLAVSGARHFKQKIKDGRQQEGIDFFMQLANAPIDRIVIENPICIMSKQWRKPDQIIQPYWFGDEFQKTTCLWLKNVPKLKPTQIVGKGDFTIFKSGKKMASWFNKGGVNRSAERSKTFPGIAQAIAIQWGLLDNYPISNINLTLF